MREAPQHEVRGPGARPCSPSRVQASATRQRAAIEGFVKRAGYEVVDWFADLAVSGADTIEARPGFSTMKVRIAGLSQNVSVSSGFLLIRPKS
jgi:Resolvase, N terminal domain